MMEQLLLHLIGDYITQSHWMAVNKTKRFTPAFLHALVYSLPFMFIGSHTAVAVIFVTHFFIDRYRLARIVVWMKNIFLDPNGWAAMGRNEIGGEWHLENWWGNCNETGYPKSTPPWLAVWLLIVCDNTLHLSINYAALRWL